MWIVSIAFALAWQGALAQNTPPYWSQSGNSDATLNSKLGTTKDLPLRLITNDLERLRIDPTGRVAIGTTLTRGKLTLFNGVSTTPAASWVTTISPMLVSYADAKGGNGDFYLLQASNTVTTRSNIINRRARGTLSAPAAVQNNDYIGSFQASGYDGSAFQNAANIDFFADGTPSAGNVPVRIAFSTGTNLKNRTERLVIKSYGDVYIAERVGIGTNRAVAGRLQVENDINDEFTPAIYGRGALFGIEGVGESQGVSGVGSYTGVGGFGGRIGVEGRGDSIGVYGLGRMGTGVYGVSEASSSAASYAGYFISSNWRGLYAQGYNGYYAGYFQGSVYTTGTYQSSDVRLKKNITDMNGALWLINQLQPKQYEFRSDGYFGKLNLPEGIHYGLIAQDLEKVLPTLVKDASTNTKDLEPEIFADPKLGKKPEVKKAAGEKIEFKAVNYTELIPILISGMQELAAENKVLKKELADLRQLILELKNERAVTTITGTASLGQSTPNPAKGTARISYQIPSSSRAQLLLTDNGGKTIKAISLTQVGYVDVNTASLSSGIYNYTLVVDGKVVETKKLAVIR